MVISLNVYVCRVVDWDALPPRCKLAGDGMESMPTPKALTTDSAARYEIRLQGFLDPGWADRLDVASIQVESQPGAAPITVVTGAFQDQAALAGALSLLYDLGLPLLSVACIDIEPDKLV